jgi:hypothetical protein
VAGCGSASHASAAARPFVYVGNTKSDEISQYSASPSDAGALAPLTPATVPTGPFPYTIAVDPQGTSAYATSSASEISQYTISPITGQLTPKSPATVATPPNPEPIAVSPEREVRLCRQLRWMRLRTPEVPCRCRRGRRETAAREAVLSRGIPDRPQNRCAQPGANREDDNW